MTCKLGCLDVSITRAFAANPAQKSDGLVAFFSFNVIDPNTGIILMVNNNFSLRGEKDNWKVYSRFQTIPDYDAPEDVPDKDAIKPLFFTSFFPESKNDQEIADMRRDFFNDLAAEIFTKIEYYKKLKTTKKEFATPRVD